MSVTNLHINSRFHKFVFYNIISPLKTPSSGPTKYKGVPPPQEKNIFSLREKHIWAVQFILPNLVANMSHSETLNV